jgi:hypothetical protein
MAPANPSNKADVVESDSATYLIDCLRSITKEMSLSVSDVAIETYGVPKASEIPVLAYDGEPEQSNNDLEPERSVSSMLAPHPNTNENEQSQSELQKGSSESIVEFFKSYVSVSPGNTAEEIYGKSPKKTTAAAASTKQYHDDDGEELLVVGRSTSYASASQSTTVQRTGRHL